ncbi:MAG: hypothetical protein B6D54_00640 [Epsilonproteobacteria bacterium 4484_65]|nr:MAG: hypothetical protein B6D54_00640 [Epsilonproteobacteria bacterium 4484_65]
MSMIGYIIISVFVLILILFVYIEYKNEKNYQEERRQKRQTNRKEEKSSTKKTPIVKPTEVPKQILREKKPPYVAPKKETVESPTMEKETIEVTEKPKIVALSLRNYPKFDHSRLLEMGLSDEEAKEFVAELIPQIGAQIPLIKEAIALSDFQNMERLTHTIKGSSTTVGTGGVSDLLVEFNTYLKTGTEPVLAEAYLEQLNHYYEELKEQYA